MKTVLMVAEKPSLAQSIAKILSKGSCSSRKGLNGACSVHEFIGSFQGQNVRFKMTSVCGHVMSLDFTGKYNNWDKVDPAELFSKAPTEKKEANPKLNMVKFLQVEARGCDFVVLWLDCDKEGENICFEVLDAVQPVMTKAEGRGRSVFRAKFSSITDADIWAAMSRLGTPNHNEALSVDARQELDLRIGCAFTRFQTKYFQGKYGNLDSSLISFGPCQTPTLGFCVERHDKIQSFKSETYWVLQAKVFKGKDSPVTLDWSRVRVFDRDVGHMFVNLAKTSKEAKVESVSKKEKVKQRPQALNTVEMLRVASSALGLGPQHTMQVAERLYTQGYISYPRTETTHYPDNFDLKGALQQQANTPQWSAEVRALLASGLNRPRKGTDAGDHPPITPMRAASETELGSDGWRLFDYITRHFISSVSEDCRFLQTSICFSIGPETFSCTGKTLISPGFTSVMPWQGIPLEEALPSCDRGDVFSVDEVRLVEKQTCPPDYLTEAELITLMEKHGIGTDASIPVHINNICQRNYVTVENGRRLKPTNLGIVLVHGYHRIDAELVLPWIRSAVEKQLSLIALGQADFSQVLSHALDIFKRKFHYFVDSINSELKTHKTHTQHTQHTHKTHNTHTTHTKYTQNTHKTHTTYTKYTKHTHNTQNTQNTHTTHKIHKTHTTHTKYIQHTKHTTHTQNTQNTHKIHTNTHKIHTNTHKIHTTQHTNTHKIHTTHKTHTKYTKHTLNTYNTTHKTHTKYTKHTQHTHKIHTTHTKYIQHTKHTQ
ncbi:DNA topoisomerase 3-beta-1, partial [Boleophthalmus pectinirostris]|uniref:DNA topoisomerase 3-beta-1 n=1 Tax=Boleophthalmus pectinirostris TaxID=150288 RepID=UPI002432F2FF